jgi:hypothetical protein
MLSMALASLESGLAEPSRKPRKLRALCAGTPGFAGAWGGTLPSCFQRTSNRSGRFFTMSRRAWMLVSVVLEQNCRLRSPWQQSASSASLGKPTMRLSRLGLAPARPKRSSNSDSPTETVMVRLSGVTTGPRIPESSGGSFVSTWATGPPCIKNAMRSLSVRNSRSRSSRSLASTSNDTSMPDAGRGVTMPVWCLPWNAWRSSVLSLLGASVTCAGLAAMAGQLRAEPANATPAAPMPIKTRRRCAENCSESFM